MRALCMLALVGCTGAETDATDATDVTDDTDVIVDVACRDTWPVDAVGTTWTFGPTEGWRGGPFVATEVAQGAGVDPDGREGWVIAGSFEFDRPEGERFEVDTTRVYRCGTAGYGILYEREVTVFENEDGIETTERTVVYGEPLIEVGLDIRVGGRWRSVTERVVTENGSVIEDGSVSRSCTGVADEPPVFDGAPVGVRFDCIGDLDLDMVVADGIGPVRYGDFRQLTALDVPE